MITRHSEVMKKPNHKNTLGPRIAIYPYRPLRTQEYLLYVFLGIFAVGMPLVYGIIRFQYGYTKYGEIVAHLWGRPWFILAGFALITSLLLIVHRKRLASRFIALHENGLVLALSTKNAFRWEHLAGISASITRPGVVGWSPRQQYHATIYPNVGKAIQLNDDFIGFPECLTRIKAKLYPRIIPGLSANFQSGQWIYFGPVAIQVHKLKIQNNQYDWSQVETVRVESGYLVVEWINQNRQRIPIAKIPNIEILLHLINTGVTA
ncbi:MAG: hypothetical protein A2W33_04725 [Chloroflexi bacterium RBG_16_52_11]|nr:MAG: hypothetical protein A2W33_04725 [Chloroflexi bacterium RBG_16_52_11]